jgi:hypothetical protein
MTSSALDIYESQKAEQMGEDSPTTEPATFDPDGEYKEDLSGVFDNSTITENKDVGNVEQKNKQPRFSIAGLPYEKTVMLGRNIYLSYRDETYKIDFITEDEQGLQILWLV